MTSRKPFGTLAALVIFCMSVLLALPAVGSAAEEPTTAPAEAPADGSDEKVTFVVGTTDDISSANPFAATTTSTDYDMLFLSYDMLLNFDRETLEPAPGIAESWEVSPDGKTYTFKIREGMTWNDGKPVTAHDVEFTYDFIYNADGGTGAFKGYLGDPKDFRAVDDYTFEWEMATATMAPVTPPYIPILPAHVWSKLEGSDSAELKGYDAMPQIGSGPFKLTEWEPGQFIRFEARDSFWMGKPKVDEVVFRIFQNQEAMVQAFKSGEVDAVHNLVPSLYDNLKDTPGVELLETDASQVYNLAFNLTPDAEDWVGTEPSWHQGIESTGSDALKDPEVRKAIAYAMDKDALVDRVLGGHGTPADSFILPIFSQWYTAPTAELSYPHDMEKAKQMMAAAGYEDSDGDGVREAPDGTPLEFDLLVLANNESSNGAGKYVREWLTELGWKVNLKALSGGKISSLWYDSDYDGYIWYWTGDPDPDFMLSIFTADQCLVWSDTCWSDPEYEELYAKQRTQTVVEERKATVSEMQNIYYEEVPEVMLFYTHDLQAVRSDKWTGFQSSPDPGGGYIYGWGPFSYINVEPAEGAAAVAAGESGGSKAILYIGIGALLLVGILLVLRARSRRAEDDS